MVEGGDAVGGDEEQLVVGQGIDVADFAARTEGKGGEVGLEKSGRHYVDGTTWKYRKPVIFNSAKPEDLVVASERLRGCVRAVGQNGFRVWTGLNDGRESV